MAVNLRQEGKVVSAILKAMRHMQNKAFQVRFTRRRLAVPLDEPPSLAHGAHLLEDESGA